MTNHKSRVRCVVGIRLATRFLLARAVQIGGDTPGHAGLFPR
jgi:hypothetical protein